MNITDELPKNSVFEVMPGYTMYQNFSFVNETWAQNQTSGFQYHSIKNINDCINRCMDYNTLMNQTTDQPVEEYDYYQYPIYKTLFDQFPCDTVVFSQESKSCAMMKRALDFVDDWINWSYSPAMNNITVSIDIYGKLQHDFVAAFYRV